MAWDLWQSDPSEHDGEINIALSMATLVLTPLNSGLGALELV